MRSRRVVEREELDAPKQPACQQLTASCSEAYSKPSAVAPTRWVRISVTSPRTSSTVPTNTVIGVCSADAAIAAT